MRLTFPVDQSLPKNLLFASIVQAGLLIATAASFDEGHSFKVVIYSMIAFWISSVWMALRRRDAPTHGDLIFAKYGFIGILFVLEIFAGLAKICGLARPY